ncbi:MAG: helix-turn-helix domain-containing protein [Spirochaetaceae bacterium]|jgi:transcriptional regulator with XRE-family HTH domain|nr:helix-turn-helix domain-containing protein [Spirochaetaceae bacterium]
MDTIFKRNLRLELNYLGLTVQELADKAGIAKGALRGYLGKQSSMPPADVAIKIAAALGVSVEYLVTGNDKHPTKNNLSECRIYAENQKNAIKTELIKTISKNIDEAFINLRNI